MRRTFWLAGAILLSAALAGCGGGSSGSVSVPPPPSFTVSLSSTSLVLIPGGTAQIVQVSIAAQNGFAGSVTVSATGLPVGVTVSPSSLTLSAGGSGAFTFTASSTAGIVDQSSTLEAASGSLRVDSSLQLVVTGPPIPDPFHMIGGALVHGFYDESRQLLFATNPGLNELDAFSGTDLSVRARATVPQAWGIDQMADNKTLVIGTAAQEILTVDEDTLVVTPHPVTGIGKTIFGLFYPNVVALANGKVLIIGQEEGIDSSDILEGGQFLIEWDSIANTFKILEPTTQGLWETDRLARSRDHKWAVFSADQFYLYSSDADTLTTVPLTTVNPPQNAFGVRGYAVNADGTKIAVASATQVTFLDRTFNVLGITPIPSAFQTARTVVEFSPDGSKLYLQYDLPTAIEVLDANQYTALGFFPGDTAPEDNLAGLLTIQASGRAVVGAERGLLQVDLTKRPIPNPANGGLPAAACGIPSTNAPLNKSVQLSILNAAPGTSYYLGGQPAPLLANGTLLQIPASSVAGPVDVECIASDENNLLRVFGFSYGVQGLGVSANLLPPIGNPVLLVFGFGFSPNPFDVPSVTIGGQATVKVQSLGDLGLGSFQGVSALLPQGTPGQSPDITISSADGSATLTQQVTYIPSATIVPASGLLQILYDSHRNLLYALKAAEIDVLNPVTLQWQTPFPLPGPGGSTGNYNTMALSPDGSRLVAVSPNGYVGVLNPGSPSGVSVVTGTNPGTQTGSVAITKFNKALIAGSPNVEVDLATLGVRTFFGQLGDVLRTSADGGLLYGLALNISSGEAFAIDPATYSVETSVYGFLFWTDLAVSADGSQFAGIDGSPGAAGDIIGFFDPNLHFLNTNEYPLVSPPDDVQVIGANFGPQGKVLVVALGDSIEFWDAAKGTLRARLMTPEQLHSLVYPEGPVAPQVALDAAGQTIFAISQTGLTAMKLSQPVDNLASQAWALGAHSAVQQGALSGGLKARAAAMQNSRSK